MKNKKGKGMSRLSKRLTERAEELNLKQVEIAERLGMTPQSVSEVFRGNTSTPRRWRELAAILQIPESEMRELMTEAALEADKKPIKAMLKTTLPSLTAGGEVRIGSPIPQHTLDRMIPVLGEAVGGNDGEYIFNGQVLDYIAAPPSLANVRDGYAVFVDGESMSPRYRPGETAYVHPGKPPRRGDDVIVQLRPTSEGAPPRGYIKEFIGWTAKELVLCQHNPPGEVRFARDEVVSVHPIVLSGKY